MGRLFALSSCRFTGMFFVAFVLAVSLSTRARAELVRETLVPGDTNCDGQLDMSDAVFTLNYLFLGTTFPPCPFADRPELLAQVESLEMSRALLEHTIAGLQAELDEAQLEIRATGALLVETQTSLTETQTLLEACVQSLPKPAYTVRGLGFIADAPKHSIARAVNDVGQVVGYSGFGTKAYTWQAGTLTYIGHLAPSGGMQAMDINNSGFLVGLISGALGPLPFVLEGDSLSPLPVSPGSNSGMAIAVNDLGQIVGGNDGAVLWSEGQRIPLASGVMANDINTSGQVVGTASVNSNHHAAFWQNGVFTDLGTLPGGQSSQAHSINDAGEIVGTSALNHTGSGTTPSRAVFWSSFTSSIQDLGTPPETELLSGEANAINNHGQVVGVIDVGEDGNSVRRAFVWEVSTGMVDLNDLIDPASRWTLVVATDINNVGQIVGMGINPQGFTEAFLLTSVQ